MAPAEGETKTTMMDAGGFITKNSTLRLAAAVPCKAELNLIGETAIWLGGL